MSIEIPLVLEIEKNQCLYNYNLPEYNRKDIVEEAWTTVAANVNLPVIECKDKWKNIRSSFVRSLKTHSGKMKKPYYLTNYLKFILPFIKPNSNSSNSNPEDFHIDSNENTLEEIPVAVKMEPPDFDTTEIDSIATGEVAIEKIESEHVTHHGLRKRKRPGSLKNYIVYPRLKSKRITTNPAIIPKSENNAMRFFLLSLLPEFDTMDEEQIRLFKIKVMTLIDEIKTDSSNIRAELSTSSENIVLQKRLINLLLKNLEKSL